MKNNTGENKSNKTNGFIGKISKINFSEQIQEWRKTKHETIPIKCDEVDIFKYIEIS